MKDFTITPSEAGQRLLHYVSRLLPGASMGLLRKSLRKKNILLNGKKAEGKETLHAGDVVRIYFSGETLTKFMAPAKEESAGQEPRWDDFQKYILYEDDDVLVLHKPAGLLSQGDGSGAPSLNDGLLYYLRASITPGFKPAICNRLDRNTSGIVLAGKSVEALQMLTRLIKERQFAKYYTAIAIGSTPDKGTLTGYMVKDHTANRARYTEEEEPGAVPIETRYETLGRFTLDGLALSLVKVHLITGRSHQIRLHFSSMGHPLLGDRKYGGRYSKMEWCKTHGVNRQMLHASDIIFPQMEGKWAYLSMKRFHDDLPKDMKKILTAAEKSSEEVLA